MIRDQWFRLPPGVRFAVACGAGLVVLLALLFVVPNLWNRASNAWWGRGTESRRAEIQADAAEAQKWKGVAEGALEELEDAKRQLAEETRRREAAEKVLADRRKVTDSARAEYDAALARPAPAPDAGASSDDLCERARRLGVRCD